MAAVEGFKSTLPQGDGIPEARLPEATETKEKPGDFDSSVVSSFSDVVLQATNPSMDSSDKVSFRDRLKKVRQIRTTRRTPSPSTFEPTGPLDFSTSPLTLPTVKEVSSLSLPILNKPAPRIDNDIDIFLSQEVVRTVNIDTSHTNGHLFEVPRTPPLPTTPPPTLPDSPPPSILTEEDNSLSPTLYPGDVQFSTTISDEVFIDNHHSDQTISTGMSTNDATPTEYATPTIVFDERRRSVMSNTSAMDLQFKPTLKKWDVVNLNEVNGTPPSISSESCRDLKSFSDVRTRSYSGVSRISSVNVEQSLDSITEITDTLDQQDSPLLPLLIQERLMTGNLTEGDVLVTQVAKTSWQTKPLLIEDDFKTASACELTEHVTNDTSLSATLKDQNKLPVRKPKKRAHSMYEEHHKMLLDMGEGGSLSEDEDRGSGNLNRLNQDIPKSISSLFEAVASGIPGLAESSSGESSPQKIHSTLQVTTEAPLPQRSIQVSSQQRSLSPERSLSSERSLSPGKSLSPERSLSPEPMNSLKPKEQKAVPAAVKENLKKNERQLMMKVHMHTVHPGIMYKMFRVAATTTCVDLVVMALKKANLIEDLHSYSLYHVHNTTKVILHVLQESDCPLSYLSATSPSHWELRRRMDNTKIVNVNIELPGVSTKCLSLTLSTFTTSQEVIRLISRKLGLTVEEYKEPFRLLVASDKDERLMGSDSPLLYQRSTSSHFKLVDIVQYLTRSQPSQLGAVPIPKDFETAKVMLLQKHDRLVQLEEELVVKDYTVEQTMRDLQDVRGISDQLQTQNKVLESNIITEQEKQKVSMQSIEELHEVISQLNTENKNLTGQLTFLKAEDGRMKEVVHKNEIALTKLHFAMNEQATSSKESIVELERDNSLLQQERAELTELLEELSKEITQLKSAQSKVTGEEILTTPLTNKETLSVTVSLSHAEQEKVTFDNNTESGGCIVKTIAESSDALDKLLPRDRLLKINGEDVSTYCHEAVLDVLERYSGGSIVHIVVHRDSTKDEVQSDITTQQIDHLREECSRLTHELQVTSSTLVDHKVQLEEREGEIERIQRENQLLMNRQVKDINDLRIQLIDSQPSKTDESESLADILQEASREELLDTLKTVEADCLKNKDALDRLFALIVGHTPDLLSLMAEVQQPEGESEEGEDDDGALTVIPNTGGWI